MIFVVYRYTAALPDSVVTSAVFGSRTSFKEVLVKSPCRVCWDHSCLLSAKSIDGTAENGKYNARTMLRVM